MMRKLTTVILIILSICKAFAQENQNQICFGKSYLFTSDIETEPCAGAQVSLNIKKIPKKLSCTITVDDKKISGYLIKNTDPSNNSYTNLYNFYRSSNTKKIYLFVRFYKEANVSKADIINEDWIQAFKPCFDHKLMTLEVE